MENNKNPYTFVIRGKEKQELYSWYWFYTNDCSNLQVSRYPRFNPAATRVDKEIKLEHSLRYKEDREKANNVWTKIRKLSNNERQG